MPQRVRAPQFIGGTNVLVSRQAADERSINFFKETTSSSGKTKEYLRPAEGLQRFATLDDIDTTAEFYQDGHAFAVCGVTFAEIFQDGTHATRGAVAYDGTQSTICSNGTAGSQLCIVSSGHLYIYDLNTHTLTEQAAFAGIDIAMCEFMDGYFFALRAGSRRVYFSALEDGTSWDTTFDYIERSWGSDDIIFMKRAGRQIFLVGSKTSEVWADVGNATQPFAPIQGAFLDIGCIAQATGQRDGDTLTWLSQDELGGGLVVRVQGYQTPTISPYGIVTRIQSSTDLAGADAFVHQLDAHRFYWLYLPGLDTTPVYDFTEQQWAERAMWDTVQGVWQPHIARCHMYAFQKNLVGVRDTGAIYQMSPTFLTNLVQP